MGYIARPVCTLFFPRSFLASFVTKRVTEKLL